MPLPPDADPSGFLERAPVLASLLPDAAIEAALSRGDAGALYRALLARLSAERAGPSRDTLAALVADRTLFVMAEQPPTVRSVLGTGTGFLGRPLRAEEGTPYIATRVFRLFGLPLWPLGQHLVRRGVDGALQVLGTVPRDRRFLALRGVSVLALATVGIGLPALMSMSVMRGEVFLANGLSRPVQVCVDGRCEVLQPEQLVHDTRFFLPGARRVEASWPGEPEPFETVELPREKRAVYHVLGAAPLYARLEQGASSSLRPVRQVDQLGVAETLELRDGGWFEVFQAHADAGRWPDAATLAEAVALHDSSAPHAREQAARAWLRTKDVARAARFGERLAARFPEDLSAQRLALELLVAAGRLDDARKRASALAAAHPTSVDHALLPVLLETPEAQVDLLRELKQRFHSAPVVNRALARAFFIQGRSAEVFPLLNEARGVQPESLEDLELRVRVLLHTRQVGEASNEVRRYGKELTRRSWGLAVLAGRLARVAGPDRTLYVTRDFLPPKPREPGKRLPASDATLKAIPQVQGALSPKPPSRPASFAESLRGPERELLFQLLAADGSVKDAELKALPEGLARDVILLSRAVLTHLDEALALAEKAPDSVLSRLEPDAAAVLALEFSRLGRKEEADRVFGAHLPLLLARERLEHYVAGGGPPSPEFSRLPPGLRVAAHLARARSQPENAEREHARARDADILQGLARRALDTWQDPVAERTPPVLIEYNRERDPYYLRYRRHISTGELTRPKPEPPAKKKSWAEAGGP